MDFAKRWSRKPGLLLLLASATVLLVCLVVFGAAHQGADSVAILSIPSLWFGGVIILPFILYVLIGIVWKRLDRIVR